MSTSGTYSFGVTRDDIIRQALLNIGKLDRYDVPDAYVTKDCAMVLNMMCKQWMGNSDFAPGLKVWTRKRGHLFLSNTTGQYSVGPSATGWTNSYVHPTLAAAAAAAATTLVLSSVTGIAATYKIGIQLDDGSLYWTTVSSVSSPNVVIAAGLPSKASANNQVFAYQTTAQNVLAVEAAVLRYQDLNDFPLRIMQTTQDYDNLTNKQQPTYLQDPTAIYFETQLGNSFIYTDIGAASDVTKHIVLTYQEPVQDFNNPTDNPYYPPEYYLALVWGLSKLICPQFNRIWTQQMQDSHDAAVAIGRHKDPEMSSLFFQPGLE